MGVSTITMRINGFKSNPILVYGVWTMRPRMIGALPWYTVSSCFTKGDRNPYLWTLKDNIVEESLLNISTVPSVLLFIIGRDAVGSGSCAESPHYQIFFDAFYPIIAAGIIAMLLLFFMTIHACSKLISYKSLANSLSTFWKWTIAIGGLNMVIAFAGQWLLWGSKLQFAISVFHQQL